jgi:molybdopterin-containing oxidoreductase family iron-sulfur binding subunit
MKEPTSLNTGRRYWRSLEELADTEDFRDLLQREFPRQAAAWDGSLSRRRFLQLIGASLALGGLTGCLSQPTEKIVPYVKSPEEVVPGLPLFFATAITLGGYATGVLVESHEGRPTKIEGNPDHPDSLGATDAITQAAVLDLYDPDRAQNVLHEDKASTWEAFAPALAAEIEKEKARQGAGLRILTGTVTSPTLADQLAALLKAYPAAKWHQYEAVSRDNALEGARLAFGEAVEAHYRLDQADVILALDADLLASGPGHVRYARQFADRRRAGQATMNRLYAIESTPSLTGAMADHRLPVRASQVAAVAQAIAAQSGVAGVQASETAAVPEKWLAPLVKDLQAHRGTSLVVAGEYQAPIVHALAHAINDALGNVGTTVVYTAPVAATAVNQIESLRQLTQEMAAGQVDLLVILGGNPVYDAPADLAFADALGKVPFRVHLSLYEDETSALCTWHLPQAHSLEAWSDARASDGTITIMQPLIAPLYDGKTAHEIVSLLLGESGKTAHDIVRGRWEGQTGIADFNTFWQTALHDGKVAGTELPPRPVTLQVNLAGPAMPAATGLEIIFRPDPTVWDGSFTNNGWLQELAKPLTKITWDNVAMVSPATAQRLSLANEVVVELAYQGRTVKAPIWIQPGHPDDAVTAYLGYGRTRAGHVGTGAGYNAYALRSADAPWGGSGLEMRQTSERRSLASTQQHFNMEGRDLVREGTLAAFQANPGFLQGEGDKEAVSFYPDPKSEGYAWGLSIDLGACIGCNACVVACQAENNIPVVGKDQVARGREMQWMRVDHYFEGSLDNPEVVHQPVPCMHCEYAPCEPVCPVAATTHSPEGINEMVYNRCVGTRYCSNNCPYKVRRFNFLQFSGYDTESLKALRNPNVTVRGRGVMEKCTYCVQRVNAARLAAEKEGRSLTDGEVVTACQQACPAQAIIFGDVNDPQSRVSQVKQGPLSYGLLAELNTRPRTTYVAKLRNPNPEIEE